MASIVWSPYPSDEANELCQQPNPEFDNTFLIVLLNTILLAFPSSAKWENSRFLNRFFMGNVSKLPDVRFVIEIIYPYQILDLTFVLYDELVNGGLA